MSFFPLLGQISVFLKAVTSSNSVEVQSRDEEEGEKEEEYPGKTIELDSVSTEHEEGELDWTSKLPDELLVNVLSRLTLEEAIRTSVLSSRWKHLWRFADLELDFDANDELEAAANKGDTANLCPEQRLRFENRVNGVVMQMHNCAPRVRKFRAFYQLSKAGDSNGHIHRWLEFAISKRVESLHLAFNLTYARRTLHYVFSENCYRHMKTPAGLSQMKPLRSLWLGRVDISSEIAQHFIANCPLLEELVLVSSPALTELRVVSHHSLKHLEVRRCSGLKLLVIDHAPRLARFVHDTSSIRGEFRMSNCPCLVDLVLYFSIHSPGLMLTSLSCYANRLESLSLEIAPEYMPANDVVEHTRLERLTVGVSAEGNSSLLRLIPLINACPRLHTLQLFLRSFAGPDNLGPGQRLSMIEGVVKVSRESVRVVEMVGFRGCVMECEFVEYVMEYFVGLERIVIDRSVGAPFNCLSYGADSVTRGCRNLCSKEEANEAERVALEFRSRAPSTLEFVVI